ncbi:MAG: hypothetical protein JNM74_21880 [Myxococcales bacterium]|nr:hypothetical protein [Myxococcales bacterium]
MNRRSLTLIFTSLGLLSIVATERPAASETGGRTTCEAIVPKLDEILGKTEVVRVNQDNLSRGVSLVVKGATRPRGIVWKTPTPGLEGASLRFRKTAGTSENAVVACEFQRWGGRWALSAYDSGNVRRDAPSEWSRTWSRATAPGEWAYAVIVNVNSPSTEGVLMIQ